MSAATVQKPKPRLKAAAMVGVALYAVLAASLLGATLVDMVYARTEPMLDGAEVADVLLVLTGLVVLMGAAAIALAWRAPVTRNLLVASVGLIVLTLAATPMLGAWLAAAHGWVGPIVRLVAVTLPCGLAVVALYRYAGEARRREA